MVPQDPQSSLNPSMRVGEQIAETLRQHQALSKSNAQVRSIELLEMVQIGDPERVAVSYPHQISGGMQQRVLIAMALSTEPSLLIMDEPTTSLDVTTQAVILDLIRDLIHGQRTAALYVTHNLGVVASLCDHVGVLYAGELVEDAATSRLYRQPLHPYTQGLLDSVPQPGETKEEMQLRSIQGQIPELGLRPSGCIFAPRCPLKIDICDERPPLFAVVDGHHSRCHRWEEILRGDIDAKQPPPPVEPASTFNPSAAPIFSGDQVEVHFPVPRSVDEVLTGKKGKLVRAVDGVNLKISQGETLGLVGESGSGKTTLSRAIMGLVPKSKGSMELLSFKLPPTVSDRDLSILQHLQMVFQNPDEALNPYLTVGETLRRPLITLLGMTHAEADHRVEEILTAVRLPTSYQHRRPNQLSGGEKQRVAIARAFAAYPDLLIFDEPVSALDVSVQASILNMLNELQQERNNSQLFISHDLAVVGYVADQIAVIYLGQIMEYARARALFEPPYHPYTESLLSAIPLMDPQAQGQQIRLEGEIPSPSEKPTGCPFHPRCPRFQGQICVEQTPPWQKTSSGKRIFCHIHPEELKADQVDVTDM